jgi:hypothetical protein
MALMTKRKPARSIAERHVPLRHLSQTRNPVVLSRGHISIGRWRLARPSAWARDANPFYPPHRLIGHK